MIQKQFGCALRRGLSLVLALLMVINMGIMNIFGAEKDALAEPGSYIVQITSLTSKAPLPPVQQAFAKAFGDTAVITVDAEGNKTVTVTNHHMIVDMSLFGMGKYDANILTVEGGAILSTKTELSSDPQGDLSKPAVTKEIEVPEKIQFPLNLDENNQQVLTITVDFMNGLMGNGGDYPTTVTMTLDMAGAKADTTELQQVIKEYQTLTEENYTAESFQTLNNVLKEAETLSEGTPSMAEINHMLEKLKTARENLTYKGADYSMVEAALAKIPDNSGLYTEDTWAGLIAARDAVVNGKSILEQAEVDQMAEMIEEALKALVYAGADYSKVEEALAKIPSDLSKYTEASAARVQAAEKAVVRGLKADQQEEVDQMAAEIEAAVSALEEKHTEKNEGQGTLLDKNNLNDGIYEVSVKLWHAESDKASMAAESFYDTARIVVENGMRTMYIYTKPMTFGRITASLQEMKVADASGNYTDAKVETRDADGNPTCFSFTMSDTEQYITVKVNPHVEMMGNQDLDARILVDYNTLKLVSEKADDSTIDLEKPAAADTDNSDNRQTEAGGNNVTPKTADHAPVAFYIMIMIFAASLVAAAVRRRVR